MKLLREVPEQVQSLNHLAVAINSRVWASHQNGFVARAKKTHSARANHWYSQQDKKKVNLTAGWYAVKAKTMKGIILNMILIGGGTLLREEPSAPVCRENKEYDIRVGKKFSVR